MQEASAKEAGELDELIMDEEELADDPLPMTSSTTRKILTQSSDPTINDLYSRKKDGDLCLQPNYQRYFVWDRAKCSRLVESVLLEVPLPIIYLAEETGGKEEVIDGQQRLTAFFDYLDGHFALTGLQIRSDLNGSKFQDLDKELQKRIRRATLRAVTIQHESSEDLKFEIFARLNTGSVALNDQELRNCVYAGPYNNLIKTLAEDPDFRFLLGTTKPDKRMRDVELVLRFAAFQHATYLNYRPPTKVFLNTDMQRYRQMALSDQQGLRDSFKSSVQLIRSLLGSNAFKRYYRGTEKDPSGRWEPKKFNTSLYDVLMWGFTRYSKNQVMARLDAIREGLLYLMTEDQEFIDAIELSTSSVRAVTIRFDKWRQTLEASISDTSQQPRCFSKALKRKLFEDDPTCAICSQEIQDIDDAAIDHIEQYWMGGKTIPENARLTHRYCNWARPRTQ